MPKLIFTDTKFAGQVYRLMLEKTSVGRGDQNTLVIRDDSVSSKHCVILVNGPEVIVRDLNSRNGTFINDARLRNQQSQLKSGQTVRFGSVEARLEIEPEAEAPEGTEITAVYAHGRAMREQRRAQRQPAPANPSMQLESNAGPCPEEQTVLIPKPPGSTPARLPSPAAGAEPPAGKWSMGRTLVLAAALIFGVLVLLWVRWVRK